MNYSDAIALLTIHMARMKPSKEKDALKRVLAELPVKDAELDAYKKQYRKVSTALRQKCHRNPGAIAEALLRASH